MVETLEERIAYWVDIGTLPYQEALEIQERVYAQRKAGELPDVILAAEHPPLIDFGGRYQDNLFSDDIERELVERFGSYRDERRRINPDVRDALEQEGIHGVPFTQTERGGGATALAPGLYTFYPIVDIEGVTGERFTPESLAPQSTYKRTVDRVMLTALTTLGVPDLEIIHDQRYLDKPDRRDIWHVGEKNYKIGSKSIIVRPPYALNGFVLHAEERGLEPFRYVKACGYDESELGVTSIEKLVGPVERETVHAAVRSALAHEFGYTRIETRSLSDL